MKLFYVILLSAIVIFLCVQIYKFSGKASLERVDFSAMQAKLNQAKIDSANFQSELEYYTNPANLEKELRARFNYKSPGENTIIIVPRSESSTFSSSSLR